MKEQYIQARLTRSLHAKLRAAGERLVASAKKNPARARPTLLRGCVGLGDIIEELLWKVDQEDARKASYNADKKQRMAAIRDGMEGIHAAILDGNVDVSRQ